VVGTAIPHTPITNGAVTAVGLNHWSVAFPARFSALSPLLELRATDTLSSMTDTVTLPVSGATVAIEAWKLAGGPVDLGAQIANLKTWLAANEQSSGPYVHGGRFVVSFPVGGMEYEGGATTGVGALRPRDLPQLVRPWPEAGLPARRVVGRGLDRLHDLGALGSAPFDFSNPPVELRPQNPWVRVTAGDSYTDGEAFFQGVAWVMGAPALRSRMRELYLERHDRPVTTMDLEELLVARSAGTSWWMPSTVSCTGFPTPTLPPTYG
jgi:hypothetical protein